MRMLESTKMNGILLKENNKFDGKMNLYLKTLNFQDARSVFMLRCRMLQTRTNFHGRWPGDLCSVCGEEDTDQHVFVCPGFQDLTCGLTISSLKKRFHRRMQQEN